MTGFVSGLTNKQIHSSNTAVRRLRLGLPAPTMACVTKLPAEKTLNEASALQRAAALDEFGADLASYTKRLAEKPADCATLCNRSFCYVKGGKVAEAKADAEACIAADGTFARGHTRLAQALEGSDRPAALQACRRALSLDRDDAVALKLLTTLDLDMAAGLRVKKRLADAVEDRRDAVRGALSKGEAKPFAQKWAKLDVQARRQLVERMLARAFNEIKGCFQEAFCPAQGEVCETKHDLPLTKQNEIMRELLAVYAVCAADLTTDDVLRLSAPRRVPVDTRDPSKEEDDDDADGESAMLRMIRDASRGKEVEISGCGPVMRRLMELYRFRPFAGHPRAADLSLGLIEAQRSTLCLVVAHMLLGGDGLPTLSIPTKAFLDEAGFAELEEAMAPPAPVAAPPKKANGSKPKKAVAAPPAPPREEDLDAVEAGDDGHIVTPVDDGGAGDGWAQVPEEEAPPVEKPLTRDADELAEFEAWAACDGEAAPPTDDYSDDDEFFEEEDARRRLGPARKGGDDTAPTATRRPNNFDRAAADEECFRVAAAIAEQRNHSDSSSDGETVSDSEASQ